MVTPATPTYVANQLYDIPLADLQADPNQPRKYLDPIALEELTASVAQQNVIAPIVFRVENGICYIVAGERRCIAARKAGFATIPALFTDKPAYEEIALAENIVRADLTPIEEAEALDRLLKSKGCMQEDLAKLMGKSPASISATLSLNRLPQAIRDECRKDPTVPKRTLVEIAGKKQERSMVKAYAAYRESVNPVKKEKGEPAPPAQSALKALDGAQKKVVALDAAALGDDKEAVTAALTSLQTAIKTLLAAIAKVKNLA
ncbi:MAG: ParB/RepB/Spo0J family partition protein [Deltaproteobacteria bacterium]|nr:ParB/RepB/Spo0J family partition protein [Deltaproteobacteria bacterium]